MDFQIFFTSLEQWLTALFLYQWGMYQIGIMIAGYVVSILAARRVEPVMEARARRIKGNPDLLRVIIAFMRRLKWLFLILWLWLARIALLHFTWPSRSWLISMALTLVTVWFVVSVLTRIIRNRSVALLVALVIWTYLALYLLGFENSVSSGLDSVALTMGTVRLSLLSVTKGIAITAAMIWLAVFCGNIITNRVQLIEDISPAYRVLLGKFIKIGLILVACAFALSATGIDLTAFTVFSGAIGVGIGFGLQKVVSNFISGIIILMDKSIKPGDTIALGDTFGSIRDLRARFVSVITRDGREYLIPNEDFITQQVVNWSFSSEYVRIDVDFGVSYESDPHAVTKIAIATARKIARVSAYKDPVCWMTEFGDYALQFKLRFWISDPNNGITNVRGQVLIALWDAFQEAGIKIPFPLREIVLKTPLDVRMGKAPPQDDAE